MISFEPRPRPSQVFVLISPVIAIALSVVFCSLLLAAMGHDPLAVLRVYFLSPLLDGYSRSELFVKATPLALIAAGLAVCFRANVWNIGAAGQLHPRRSRGGRHRHSRTGRRFQHLAARGSRRRRRGRPAVGARSRPCSRSVSIPTRFS